jgi:hypothetical protein
MEFKGNKSVTSEERDSERWRRDGRYDDLIVGPQKFEVHHIILP